MTYVTQNEAVKQARKFARENGMVIRKANVLLAGNKAYAFYSKDDNQRNSAYFTLADLAGIANADGDFSYYVYAE
nr:hypothetical protein [Moraxella sp. CTOTU48717]